MIVFQRSWWLSSVWQAGQPLTPRIVQDRAETMETNTQASGNYGVLHGIRGIFEINKYKYICSFLICMVSTVSMCFADSFRNFIRQFPQLPPIPVDTKAIAQLPPTREKAKCDFVSRHEASTTLPPGGKRQLPPPTSPHRMVCLPGPN